MVFHSVIERGARPGYACFGPLSRATTEGDHDHLVNTACAMPSPWGPRTGPAQAYPGHSPITKAACVETDNARASGAVGVPAGAGPIRGAQGGGEPDTVLMRHWRSYSVDARESGPQHAGTSTALVNKSRQADL